MISKTGPLTLHEELLRDINYILILPSDENVEGLILNDFEHWDSLAVMAMVALAAKHGADVTPEQVLASESVGGFIRLVEKSQMNPLPKEEA